MNAIELEQFISQPVGQSFDATEFSYAVLTDFGNAEAKNKFQSTVASDNGCSPYATQAEPRLILATDGIDLKAEDITDGEIIACRYIDVLDRSDDFSPQTPVFPSGRRSRKRRICQPRFRIPNNLCLMAY